MLDKLTENISEDIKRQLDEKIKEGEKLDISTFRFISENAVLANHLFTEKKIKYLINELYDKYEELKNINKDLDSDNASFFTQEIIKYIVINMSFKDLPEY